MRLLAVAAHPQSLARYETGVTRAVVNTHATPTANFVFDKGYDMKPGAMREALAARVGAHCEMVDASTLATRLLGDAIGTNLFVLGYAYQQGWLPLSANAIERAIELNGTAVAMSKQAFAWGFLPPSTAGVRQFMFGLTVRTWISLRSSGCR